jgi:hypothetical protein
MTGVQQLLLVQQRVGHAQKVITFAQMVIPVRQLRCSSLHVDRASQVLAFTYAEFRYWVRKVLTEMFVELNPRYSEMANVI